MSSYLALLPPFKDYFPPTPKALTIVQTFFKSFPLVSRHQSARDRTCRTSGEPHGTAPAVIRPKPRILHLHLFVLTNSRFEGISNTMVRPTLPYGTILAQ